MTWQITYTKQAQKNAQKLASSGLKEKVKELLKLVENNLFQNPLPYEKLIGDLAGTYSRRTKIQHRLVYQVLKKSIFALMDTL